MALNLESPTWGGVESALQQQLRNQEAERRRRLVQAINVRNLRTSGIGIYPTQEAERARAMGESGILAQLGGQRIQQIFAAQEAEKQRAFQERMARWQDEQRRALEEREHRRGYQSALWAGLGNIASGGAGALAKKYGGLEGSWGALPW